ncbi:uncharacterized protein METZ01_LOCUS280414 [marine metagenome]|uniref:Uncharacterized protein n=1 Tax=marine metagenome TaxID=408172 RepID=A0A382KSW0_9ZZZZ
MQGKCILPWEGTFWVYPVAMFEYFQKLTKWYATRCFNRNPIQGLENFLVYARGCLFNIYHLRKAGVQQNADNVIAN